MNRNLSQGLWKQLWVFLLLVATVIIGINTNTTVKAASIDFPSIIAAPSGSPHIPSLDFHTSCTLLSLGAFGVNSLNETHTVQRYCTQNAIELEPFVQAGWDFVNNCTSYNSSYTTPADTCNGYWPTVLRKLAGCPVGYVLSSGICSSTNEIIPDKNLGIDSSSCPVGNPIHPNTGVKHQVETDLTSTPSSGLKFERYYNSRQGSFTSASTTMAAKFENKRWLHNYDRKLVIKDDLNNQPTNIVVRPSGKNLYFTWVNNIWQADSDISDRLVEIKDGNNTRVSWQYIIAADETVETYNPTGKLLSITRRSGRTQILGYDLPATSGGDDDSETLDTVTDDTGRQLIFTYNVQKRIASMTDPAGGIYQYTYDADDNLTSVTYPDNTVRTYHYNEQAYTNNTDLPYALTGITDEKGVRYATYTYDATGRAIITEHAGGADRHALAFDENTNTTTITDPLGSVYTRQFQTVLGVAKSIGQSQPAGSGCSAAASATSYDVNGNVASSTDFNGNKTCFAFDMTRNLETARVEGLAAATACPADLANYVPANNNERKTLTTWDANFRLPTLLTEAQRETSLSYNSHGNATSLSIRDTATNATRTWTTSYSYHPTVTGVMTQRIEDGPRTDVSDITTIDYYAPDTSCTGGHLGCRGQISTITNALGHASQITRYNAHGQPEVMTDPNGLTTTLTYDSRQRLLSRAEGAETTRYQYDNVGQVTRITFPDNSYLNYTYDNAQRLTGIADNLNNHIQYTLDAMGNRTQEDVFDPNNTLTQTRQREFDALSRLWKNIGAQSQTTELAYDANGNLKQATNPLQHSTTKSFDALDRLIQSTDPLSGQAQQTQDKLDQVTQVTDPKGIATTYTYNGLGDVLQEVSADRGTTTYAYDSAGNLITRTDARSVVQTTTYDALNRQTSRVHATVTGVPNIEAISWTYDAGSHGIGRLSSMSDESGTTTYSYDQHGRLLSKAQAVKFGTRTFTQTLSYQYDSSGRLSQTTYPSGAQIGTIYGADGRPTELKVNGNTLIQNITYQPFGAVKSWTWGNGQAHTRSFDLDGRVSQHPVGSDTRTLTYDAASQITTTADTNPIYNRAYSYDELGRLTSQTDNTTTRQWTFDANSNRTSMQSGSTVYPYTLDTNSNRLMSIAGPVAKTYTYDATGNVISDGITNFTWNAAGRLDQVVNNSKTYLYQYNGLGERINKGENSSQHFFVYDDAGHLIGEYEENLATTQANDWVLRQETVWLDDIPIAVLTKSLATNSVEVLVDNQDGTQTSSTGTWDSSSGANPYSGNSVYANANGESFQWNPDLSANGDYDVVAWWTYWSNRDTTVTYKVHHVNGVTDVTVNQRDSLLGGQWNDLGSFTLDQNSYVEIIHDGGTSTTSSADAIRFTPSALSVEIVDNQDGTQTSSTGTWNSSSGANPYSGNSVYANANGKSFRWNPDLSANGDYDVAAWWTYWSNRDTTVTYKVHHVNGVTDVTVNQRDSVLGGQWNDLGNFTLDQSSYVEIIHDGGTTTTSSADAIRFTSTNSAGPSPTYYIHADHLNTPRLIVDPTNNTLIWRWDSVQAFGSNLVDEDPDNDGTDFEYNLRFAGQYFDNETRLHYNYFRDYNPEIGRYISSDPIGLAGGLNTYGYVGGNPLRFVDPYGLFLGFNAFSGGVSFNGTAIAGDSGADGVSGGTNAQFFSNGSSGLFGVVGTGTGVDIGADVQFNAAVYNGNGSGGASSWSGTFYNVNINIGPISFSYFFGAGWRGVSIGGGIGLLPLSGSYTETNYVPIPGTITPPGTIPGSGVLPGWNNAGCEPQ